MPKEKKSATNSRRTKKQIKSEVSPIALFVRNRREELGYTQEDMAFRSGLNARFIKEFELGKKTVRLDKVTELLIFLGATLEVKSKNGDTNS
jgi:transcriptional regulator with XRE-family HTH domain